MPKKNNKTKKNKYSGMSMAQRMAYVRSAKKGAGRRKKNMRGGGFLGDAWNWAKNKIIDKGKEYINNKGISKSLYSAAPYAGKYSGLVTGAAKLADTIGYGKIRRIPKKLMF